MRLIDADELYDTLDNGFDIDLDELPETKVALLQMIKNAPTIEERKTGRWMLEPYLNGTYSHRCGVCFNVALFGGNTPRLNYCPNCGARMDE